MHLQLAIATTERSEGSDCDQLTSRGVQLRLGVDIAEAVGHDVMDQCRRGRREALGDGDARWPGDLFEDPRPRA